MKNKYNNNIFLVPLLAVLMVFIGLTNGGTSYKALDLFLYFIIFLMSYVYIFFYRGYDDKFSKHVIIILVLFLTLLSWKINKLLVIPIIINYIILIFFTKSKKVEDILEIKSILSFTYRNIPIINKILFLVSILFSIYIVFV